MKDEIKEIEEWLRDISTPTGLSYSGDRTLSNSMVDHIIEYITTLQEENDDLKNRLENAVADCNIRLQENERLRSFMKRAEDRLIEIENKYGYILDDVIFILMRGSDKE